MRCTLGQWNVDSGEVALFPGSTVPSLPNITNAKARGGSGTNLLMPGRFEHERGTHKAGKQSGHRAFREASFQPVWRTADNLDYDLQDRLDFGSSSGDFVWDNIHCAYYDNPETGYSSAGCQVVCGLPQSPARGMAPETGPWRAFIDSAYGTKQSRFVYLLFTAEELSSLDKVDDTVLKQVVRFGSSGALAKKVQQALVKQGHLQGTPDGVFGRLSLMALVDFQKRQFGAGAADGVCGEISAAALGVDLPTIANAGTAPIPAGPAEQATSGNPDLPDETDLAPDVLTMLLVALGLQPPTGTPAGPATPAGQATGSAQRAGTSTAGQAAASPPADGGRANFERAQEIVREFEGGYSDDPKDPGGATNFGITFRTLAAWRGKPVTKADVANMSYQEAKEIYFSQYWSKSSCGAMPGPLALAVYNVAVHAGLGTAATYLQKALNRNGSAVAVDGGIGGETLGAIPAAPLADVISSVIDLYDAKLRAHPNYEHFKKGFNRRVNKLRLETERWLEEDGEQTLPIPMPKLGEEGDPVVTDKVSEFIQALLAALQPGATTTTTPAITTPAITTISTTPAAGAGTTVAAAASLAVLLRQLAQGLGGNPVVLPPDSAATNVLTPVNGALGQWLGKLLDGRKSALGIIGVLASALLAPAATGAGAGAATTSPLGELIPLIGSIPGLAPILMPVSLALTAWGLLGKIDKYVRAVKQ
ncbi:glycosyl hydrolase 108 family protein [Mesorhizobium sp. dw_380]|uniref:glycosyl hydrolase 108 family protein n=1 Tax=Mesorhizobium sp. dw_380 TaxID=2812001 RepID=UPI001BDE71FD|nr:glycosyl hydrolase 108 family protein [Mesorhizobium sp. dw_380]